MRVDRRDGRCVVVNVDPQTAARDPAVLRTIARERDALLGQLGQYPADTYNAIMDYLREVRSGPALELSSSDGSANQVLWR